MAFRFSTGFILQKYVRTPNLHKQLMSYLLVYPPSLKAVGATTGIFCALLSISENGRDWFPSMISRKPLSYRCRRKGYSLPTQGLSRRHSY